MKLLDREQTLLESKSTTTTTPAINWRYRVSGMSAVASRTGSRFYPARAMNWRYRTPEMAEIDLDALPVTLNHSSKTINWRYRIDR